MKKNYFKKSLSLILTVLMLMSCWVFVAPTQADAYAPTGGYGTSDKYGTPKWDGNDVYYATWNSGTSFTTVKWPKHIYLDKSETLESAGYYYKLDWRYGNDTDYRIVNNGYIFGGWRLTSSSLPANHYTMTNMFNNYDIDPTLPDGQGTQGSSMSNTSHDLYVGLDNWDGASTVIYRNPNANATNRWAYVFMKGTPKGPGTGHYSTSGAKPNSFGGWQHWDSGWKPTDDKYTTDNGSSNWTTDCYEGTWKEIAFDVTIYDKSTLGATVTEAENILNNLKARYTPRSYNALKAAYDANKATLKTRAVSQDDITNANTAIREKITALEVRKVEITYENMFNFTEWYYSDSSRVGDAYIVNHDVAAGSFDLYSHNTLEEYTTAVSQPHTSNMYSMAVTPGKQITVEYTAKATSALVDSEVFLFWYDANGNTVTNSDGTATHNSQTFGANGTYKATFTVPASAKQAEIRFDNNNKKIASTVTFSKIAVYYADRAAEIGLENWDVRPYRKVVDYNATLNVSELVVPSREAFIFNGWNKADGTAFATTNVTSNIELYSSWTAKTLDIGYDNLFSFSDWAYNSVSTKCSGGTLDCDIQEGSVTITQTSSSPNYCYTAHSGTGLYVIKFEPINESRKFVVCYDYEATGNAKPYVLAFDTNSTYNDYDSNVEISNGYGIIEVPAGCDAIHIRFGAKEADVGAKMKIYNIAVYEESAYEYAKDYTKVRETFKYGDTKQLTYYPTREGYIFNGWEKADGTKITSVAGLSASDVIYAAWTKVWTVTFLKPDGTVYATQVVNEGESASTPTGTPFKDADETASYTFKEWVGNYTNVTSDVTVTPSYTDKAHTNITYSNPGTPSCTQNAKVDKKCGDCGYNFDRVVYDGVKEDHPEWWATGHDFENGSVVRGSAKDGKHLANCANFCGQQGYVDHAWYEASTVGATCTTPGTINLRCNCNAISTKEGELAPNVHKYIETEGTPNGDNATHTVKCDYNPEHTKSVACTDADDDCICDICDQELVHVYDQKTTTYQYVVADCYTDATYYYTCKCGKQGSETWTDEDSKLPHEWEDKGDFIKEAADCENDAIYYKKCKLCKASSEGIADETWTKADSATGHDYTSKTVRDNNDGTHSYLCANGCGTYGYNKVKEDSTACVYGDWDTTGAKEHSKTCEECSYVFTQDHNFTGWTTVAGATDEAKASHTRKCEICDKVETEDCNYDAGEATKETCLDAGYTTFTCQDCDHQYKIPGADATGHDYAGDYKYNATTDKHQRLCLNGCGTYGIGDVEGDEEACTWGYTNIKAGEHEAKCACGNKQTETCSGGTATCTVPAKCEFCNEAYGTTTAHSFNGDAVELAGDVHAYLCEYCGATSGFNGVEGATEDCSGGTATCSAEAECEVCGDEYGDLNTNNHDWSDWANVEGTKTHKRVCGYNPDHIEDGDCFSADPSIINPDCETQGYTLNVCDFCEHEWKTGYTGPLDHDWGAWVKNNDGTHTRTCKDETCKYGEDGKAKTETVNCTKENADAVVTAPTCLDAGYTTYTCKDCGYEWTADPTKATGHSYTTKKEIEKDTYKRTDKNCVRDLTYWYCCDNCEVSAGTEAELDKYKDTILYFVAEKAEGHKFVLSVVDDEKYLKSAATCTDRAVYYKSCTCGASSNDDKLVFNSGSVLSHDWNETTTYLKTPADCVNDAVYYKECTRKDCGISSAGVTNETWAKAETALGHNFDVNEDGIIDDNAYVAKVDATCTTDGVLEHYICQTQTCGKMYADKEGTTELTKVVVDALKHDFETIKERPITCEENGYTTHKICKREGCDYVDPDKKEFKATGHNFTGAYYYDNINNYHARYCVNEKCLFAKDINGEIVVDENGKYVYVKTYGLGSGDEAVKYDVIYDLDDATVVGGERCSFDNFLTSTVNGEHSHDAACVCGNRTIRVIDSDKITTQVVEPTCYRSGYTLNTCTEGTCTDTWKTDLKDQLEHIVDGDATSNGDGTHSVKCERDCGYATAKVDCSTETPATACGTKSVCDVCDGEFGKEVAHKFTNYVADEDSATCTEDGTKTAVCDTCKKVTDTVTNEDSKLGHNWLEDYVNTVDGWKFKPADFDVEIKDATCCEEGTLINYCTRCSEYKLKYEKADATKHVWPMVDGEKDWTFVSGDCSTGVVYSIICDVCLTKDTKVDTDVSHDWSVIRVHEANCMDDGFVEFACKVCEIFETFDSKSEDWDNAESEFAVLAAAYNIRAIKEHTWQVDGDERVLYIDKYATYNEDGKGHYLCTKCSATEEIVLPATFNPENHKDHYHPELGEYGVNILSVVPYVAPTCTTSGHLEYVKCTRCSYSAYDMDRDAYYLPALGHTEPNDIGECERCERKIVNEDISADCGCVCHKDNAFMQFIYKLISVFWKIFGINSSCECGSVHYKK